MRLELRVRHLLLLSWRVDRESVARVLPPGLEPAEVEGEHLVSVVALRYAGGRLGRLPVPPFSQLNVRVYVTWEQEPAVLFLDARVTPPGLAGALFGAPYRSSWLRLEEGRADARGLGVRVRYRLHGPADPGELGRHSLGLFPAGRELRGFRLRRGPATWHRAEPTERVRVDPLLALGFDVREPDLLLHCAATSFEVDLPPRPVSAH